MRKSAISIYISTLLCLSAYCNPGLVFAFDSESVFQTAQDRVPMPAPDDSKEQFTALRPQIEYKASDLRDPFIMFSENRPVESDKNLTEGQQMPVLTVSGIIWGGVFPQAIVNNKVVKTGDSVDGVEIIGINKDYIEVFFFGNKYKLDSPASGDAVNKSEGGEK